MMYIGGGGLTHRWFVENFGGGAQGAASYATLDAQAAAIAPGAEGLIFLPHLGGRTSPVDPDQQRGAWLGFTWTHRPGTLLPRRAGVDRVRLCRRASGTA